MGIYKFYSVFVKDTYLKKEIKQQQQQQKQTN